VVKRRHITASPKPLARYYLDAPVCGAWCARRPASPAGQLLDFVPPRGFDACMRLRAPSNLLSVREAECSAGRGLGAPPTSHEAAGPPSMPPADPAQAGRGQFADCY